MEKISVKKLIDFRRKSERSKGTFVNNLKLDKKVEASSGGDYWVSCLSSISNVYKTGIRDLLDDKIEILHDKIENSEDKRSKSMYQRNLDLLSNFEDFNFESIKPDEELIFLKKPDLESIININGLPIQSRPHHVFSFSNNGDEEVGAVWFVAKLDGYKKNELGMFADILYRYLNERFSEEYIVNPLYCVAIDVFTGKIVTYKNIQDGEISILIDITIDEINRSL